MLWLLFKDNTSAKLHSSVNMRKSSATSFYSTCHLQYTFQENKITTAESEREATSSNSSRNGCFLRGTKIIL